MYVSRIVTLSATRARTPITEFSITDPRPITVPSQIKLFLTVAPAIREQARNRGRVKIGPASEAKSNAGFSPVRSILAWWNAPTVPMSSQ